MKKKIARNVLVAIAIILSNMMCADVAFNYASLLCSIEHKGFSAPASVAFFVIIPYAAGIIICLILAFVVNKRIKK